jgi:aryl-alcohol dehydrogenase-like predicted oxidoreductase
MQAIADLRGWSPLMALQVEYSLAERTIERDLAPMAQELGLGVIPWSPLAGGVLTGKYKRSDLKAEASANPTGTRHNVVLAHNMLNERNLDIADEVGRVAEELGKSRAQVALAWTLLNPAVTSPIIGARTLQQLEDNLGALEVEFSEEQKQRLDAASAIDLGFPHTMIRLPMVQQVVFGGAQVEQRL